MKPILDVMSIIIEKLDTVKLIVCEHDYRYLHCIKLVTPIHAEDKTVIECLINN